AQGRAAHPGERWLPDLYPVGVAQGRACLVQPLRGRSAWGRLFPRVRCATLGWVVQRLRRKDTTPCCSIRHGDLVVRFTNDVRIGWHATPLATWASMLKRTT